LRAKRYIAQTLGVPPNASCKPGCSAINAATHVKRVPCDEFAKTGELVIEGPG
jgi:hypothetical protein